MFNHSRVALLNRQGDGIYELVREKGDTLRVFICECYAYGVAEYLETVENIGHVNVVIINSAWCGYSPDAKLYCREIGVGLFSIAEFMGALNIEQYWLYLTDEQKENFDC